MELIFLERIYFLFWIMLIIELIISLRNINYHIKKINIHIKDVNTNSIINQRSFSKEGLYA